MAHLPMPMRITPVARSTADHDKAPLFFAAMAEAASTEHVGIWQFSDILFCQGIVKVMRIRRTPIDGRRPAFVALERFLERSDTVSDTGTDTEAEVSGGWRLRKVRNLRRAACDAAAADAARMQARRS